MDAGMPNLSGTKYSCYPHHSVTIASRSPPTCGSDATAVGRQCAHRDVGMPNLSGTKFGRNGVKYDEHFVVADNNLN